MRAMRWLLAFLAAVLAAEVLAAAAASQFVLHNLATLGVDVSFADRITTTAHDVVGMLPSYGPIIGAAFLVALPIAGFIASRTGMTRSLLFTIAGGVAILAALLIMRKVFEITPIAAARSATGLATQVLAGAIAGYLFARLSAPAANKGDASGPCG